MTAKTLFKRELKKRQIKFTGPDKEGLFSCTINGTEIKVCLENIDRNYQRDGDPASVIRFVDQLLSTFEVPPWEKAKSLIYFSAEPANSTFNDALHNEVTDTLSKVVVLTDLQEGRVTWVTPSMLKEWGVSDSDVRSVAAANLARLLDGKTPEVGEIDEYKLGMVPIASVFKASVIFAPNFKDFAAPVLGWPILAVIPCRDFIYILAEKDNALLNRMGETVQREYRTSGYPVSTEVLKISDEGIEAIGKFPE